MWKNSLKNVESDNNKMLYETLLNFFYSETVLSFWISLVLEEATYPDDILKIAFKVVQWMCIQE